MSDEKWTAEQLADWLATAAETPLYEPAFYRQRLADSAKTLRSQSARIAELERDLQTACEKLIGVR